MKQLFIGIDISKEWLDISVITKDNTSAHLKVDNNLSGYKKMYQWLRQWHSKSEWLVCLEHTGIYGQPLWHYLTEKEVTYCVVAGSVITSGLSIKRGKTDKLDALTIAKFAIRYADELKPHKIPAKVIQRLKVLFAYRERLVKAKVSLEVPAGEAKTYAKDDSAQMREETSIVVRFLQERIKRIEKLMLEIIKSDAQTHDCYKLIVSVPGFGLMTGTYLLIITECFTLFSNSRQIACYGGIAPFEHSSGSSTVFYLGLEVFAKLF